MSDVSTPTQQIVQSNPANQRTTLKTAGGKTIVVRKLSVLDQLKIARAMGPFQSNNWIYREMVESAVMVEQMDGQYLPSVTNEEQIDKLFARLGDDVIETMMAWRTNEIRNAMKAAEKVLWGDEDAPSLTSEQVEAAPTETPAGG